MKVFLQQFVARYLAFWARLVIRERRPRIIGVTGSVGKTTTKEAIYAALAIPQGKTLIGPVGKSFGNLNSEIGLPLAVLFYHEVPAGWLDWLATLVTVPIRALVLATVAAYPALLVLEYAADRPGDIRRLVAIARPAVAVVTAAGPAHLELFKSVEKVAQEKAELVRTVPPNGLVLLARDNSFAAAMARQTHAAVKKIPGRGLNLALGIAAALAEHYRLPKAAVRRALDGFRGLAGRLDAKRIGQQLLIDDTYNANPLSMELALDTLAELAPQGTRRVAILGYMAELGAESERYHLEIGRSARTRADFLIGVGKPALLYDADYWYPSSSNAAQQVGEHLRPTDTILVKGSRSAAMERVLAALTKKTKEAHGTH